MPQEYLPGPPKKYYVPKEIGGETLTEMGQSLGTFSFMPPEQIGKAKTVDHRADIYACGTLIYQALSGQLPYVARNILVMVEMKAKTDPRLLADAQMLSQDTRAGCVRCQACSALSTFERAFGGGRDGEPAAVSA